MALLQPYLQEYIALDLAQRRVTLARVPVEPTATGCSVLNQLAVQAPKVLTRSLLLHRVWGPKLVGDGWLLRNVVERIPTPIQGTSSPSHGAAKGCR